MKKIIIALIIVPWLTGCYPLSKRDPATLSESAIENLPDMQLCDALYPDHTNKKIYKEIQKRKLISDEDRETMWHRSVRIGMSECAARASWGPPQKVNKTLTKGGLSKQFVYISYYYGGSSYKYLYIKNGVVTGAQN